MNIRNTGLVAGAYLLQRLFHDGDLLLEARMRNVDHMQQQVGLAHLVERRLERLDELMGQLADEADGVRQQKGQILQNDLADRRVERREELVLG